MNRQSMRIIVPFLAAAVILPIVIHFLYVPDYEHCLVTSGLSAGDFLGYCGAILSAVATIIAIILTINFTVENQKSERKLTIKPNLHSEYRPIYDFNELSKKNVIYVTIGNEYSSSAEMPYTMKTCEETKDPIKKTTNTVLFRTKNHVILYELSNVGAGTAVGTEITINGHLFLPPLALPLNTTLLFVFLLKDEILIENQRELEIVITYSDMLSIAKYEQKEKIKLFRDPQDTLLTTSQKIEWLLCKPVEK